MALLQFSLRLKVAVMKEIIRQKGAAMVEFAMVLPLFLVLVFGIIEFSLMLYDQAIITNASREGARSGIALRNPPLTTTTTPKLVDFVTQVVTNYCSTHLVTFASGGANCTATPTPNSTPTCTGPSCSSAATPLTVNVSYTYTYLVFGHLINLIAGGTWSNSTTLHATTVMNFE